ncbi:hypothetical protein PG993_009369 [Apiospora rasikravindrae]|uniref:Uncharacterized protein n=1 Tax=Apiospora rasikravindrae TaxID=990691 RepID=A0ABR1SJC6_9PEZI
MCRRAAARGRFEDARRVARLYREVLDYFEFRHRFRYLETMRGMRLNEGGGGASLFAEIEGNPDRNGAEKRRVVVKFGDNLERMYDERHWLDALTKLEHVVNVGKGGPEESFYDGVVPPTETNEAIAQFIQDYMSDASTNPLTFGKRDSVDGTSSSEVVLHAFLL